jgi:hypothetical protein
MNGVIMLKFELSVEETNLILTSLGKMSYEQVAALINKIQAQAVPQLPREERAEKESS